MGGFTWIANGVPLTAGEKRAETGDKVRCLVLVVFRGVGGNVMSELWDTWREMVVAPTSLARSNRDVCSALSEKLVIRFIVILFGKAG